MSTERLAELIRSSNRTVALTGAGISVPSGIPDFRSPGTGLWENVDPMEVAHINVFLQDPERFWSYYRPRFGMLADKQPNGAHQALAELEARGMLEAVVTQNIDTLHRKAGSQQRGRGARDDRDRLLLGLQGRLPAGGGGRDVRRPTAWRAAQCGGAVKPDVVLFGEMLPEQAMEEAYALCAGADLLLCVGTSLEVYPVAGLPEVTRRAGGSIAIVTMGPTPYDSRGRGAARRATW